MKIDFDELNARLASQFPSIVQEFSPGGKIVGHEYVCASIKGGKGESFSVNLDSVKGADFNVAGTEFVGTIAYWSKRFELDYHTAASDLATRYGFNGTSQPRPAKRRSPPSAAKEALPPPCAPVGTPEPALTHSQFGAPVAKWPYVMPDGSIAFYVARYETTDGKRPTPWSWDGASWQAKAFPEPRPLMGLDLLEADKNKPVIIVEGEPCVMALRSLTDKYLVTTWSGGAGAWKKTDFSPLYGRRVTLWPDEDKPGVKAMAGIADEIGPHCTEVKVIQVSDVGKGRDVADMVKEGKDWSQCLAWIMRRGFKVWAPPEAVAPVEPPPDAGEDPKPNPSDPYYLPFTDMGNVERLWIWFSEDLIYTEGGGWWLWNGKIWKRDAIREVKLLIGERYHAMKKRAEAEMRKAAEGSPEQSIAREARKFFHKCGDVGRITSSLELAKARFERVDDCFDAHDHLFNFENGTMDLRAGTLREHRKADLITKSAGYNVIDGDCPTFKRLIFDAMGNEDDKAKFLYTLLGSSMSGCVKDQILLLNHGFGSNGKTTLFEKVMLKVMGEYGAALNVATFLQRGMAASVGPRPDLIALRGLRYGTMSEPTTGSVLDDGLIKTVTGGDVLACRDLHKGMSQFRSQLHLFMSYNQEPRLKDFTHGMVRRLKRLAWNVQFPRNDSFEESLMSEIPHIASFLSKACGEWYRDGLTVPQSVDIDTSDYLEDQNVVLQFRNACLDVTPGMSLANTDLKAAFDDWAKANGLDEVSTTFIARRLKDMGFKQHTSNGVRRWTALSLRSSPVEDFDDDER